MAKYNFIASTGILYAYDGFYSSASIKTEMKDPKKSPLAILVGLIVTTAIYLLIAGNAGKRPLGKNTSCEPFAEKDQ